MIASPLQNSTAMKNLILALTILTGPALLACRCRPPAPITQAEFDSYDLVVKGEVVKVTEEGQDRTIYLLVKENHKGAEGDTIRIYTSVQSATCGLSASEGDVFLMYASLYEGRFRTDTCTRTALLNSDSGYQAEHVEGDLEFLRAKMEE